MKKDISFESVKKVSVAIVKADDNEMWQVVLINQNEADLENVLISSRGYGEKKGKKQETSLLRHSIPKLESGSYALIESINPDVFHLTNEYWVSFYIEKQIYDKKYIFLPDSIVEENVIQIPDLNKKGVLHT